MALSKKQPRRETGKTASRPALRERPSLGQRLQRMFTIAAPALLLFAMVVRTKLRDGTEGTAPLFYAFPWPVIAVCWLIFAVIMRRKRRWVVLGGLACGVAVLAMFQEVKGVPPATAAAPSPRVKVLFWNVAHATEFPEELHALIDSKKPDIIGLAEFNKPTPEILEGFTRRHPAFQIKALNASMLCAVRGELQVEKIMSIQQRSRLSVLTVRLKDDPLPWSVTLADIKPWPLNPRTLFIDQIRENGLLGSRSLVMGDFNTPFESVAFDSWRENAWHALANAPGSPRIETWPLGLPLLAIDHVWMSRDCIPVSGETGTVWPFDHKWIFSEIGLVKGSKG